MPRIKFLIINNRQNGKETYLFGYQTDAWHSVETRKLVYIGENLEETIRKMVENILSCGILLLFYFVV